MNSIEDYIREFSNEVSILTRTYFTLKSINVTASKDEKVLAALNTSSATWSTILYSLQTTMFISLGRIFDINDEAFSIHKLVKYCSEHIEEFDRVSLRGRKLHSNEQEPEWLEGYLNSAHYPKKEELLKLRGEVSKQSKIYKEKYQPIRHKLMAHTELAAIGNADILFAATNIKELEEVISFCNQIKLAIYGQYYNGRKISLPGNVLFDFNDILDEDIKQLLELITSKA